jgi:hypothetical protein
MTDIEDYKEGMTYEVFMHRAFRNYVPILLITWYLPRCLLIIWTLTDPERFLSSRINMWKILQHPKLKISR